jgi:NAD(P)-dependent dehydrogenase (short-subunit alcohol dehydrogenase family)
VRGLWGSRPRWRRYEGKVVVVTGGASGIGLALARAFAARGARLALLDLDGAAAEARAAELAAGGGEALGLCCDVTDDGACAAAIAAVRSRFGGVDVLVNNAGITARDSVLAMEPAAVRRVMAVNFFGAVACTKAALESLVARRGQVIVTSSIAGLVPVLGRSAYCASKRALHGYFATLRAELRHRGVDVLIACPTFVATDLQRRAIGGDGERTDRPQSTLGKIDTPEVVAEQIVAAASRGQGLLVFSAMGKFSYLLNFAAPELFEKLMARKFGSELER